MSAVVFFETLPATLAPSACRRALASSRVMLCSEPVITNVLPRNGRSRDFGSADGQRMPAASERFDDLYVVWLMKKSMNGRRDDGADVWHLLQPLLVGREQFLESSELIGQRQGSRLAHIADTEAIEKPRVSRLFALLERRDALLRRLLAKPFEFGKLLGSQPIEIRRSLHDALLHELVY